MKNLFKDTVCACSQLEMSKHYDLATEFRCKKGDAPCFGMHVKGDFTVNAMQILTCAAIIAGACIVGSVVKAFKKKA